MPCSVKVSKACTGKLRVRKTNNASYFINFIHSLCVSILSPGGSLCIHRSVDHHVPCGEHCVHLLHIQSRGTAQQVVYEQVFVQLLCVSLAAILLCRIYFQDNFSIILCCVSHCIIIFLLPFPIGSVPVLVWSCPVSIFC